MTGLDIIATMSEEITVDPEVETMTTTATRRAVAIDETTAMNRATATAIDTTAETTVIATIGTQIETEFAATGERTNTMTIERTIGGALMTGMTAMIEGGMTIVDADGQNRGVAAEAGVERGGDGRREPSPRPPPPPPLGPLLRLPPPLSQRVP